MDVINKQPKAGKSFLSQTEDCSLGDSLSSPYEKLLSLCVSTQFHVPFSDLMRFKCDMQIFLQSFKRDSMYTVRQQDPGVWEGNLTFEGELT